MTNSSNIGPQIRFYTLPREERRRITDNMDKISQDLVMWQEKLDRAQNAVDEAKHHVETNKYCLRLIENKYDFT